MVKTPAARHGVRGLPAEHPRQDARDGVFGARQRLRRRVDAACTWTEVARGVDPRDFTIRTALQRFNETADLWKELRKSRPVNMSAVLARASRLARG